MKIPEKPPNRNALWQPRSEEEYEKLKPFVELANANYLHWDELLYDDRFKGIELEKLWQLIKISRNFNERPIVVGDSILNYVQTQGIERMLHDLDFRTGGKIGLAEETPEPSLKNKYLVNSLMEEAIASSQLEGATTSRLAAKQMLRENRKPRTISEQMIVNSYLTMNFIRENKKENKKLTPQLIKELHKRITKNTLDDSNDEGNFRKTNEIKVFLKDNPELAVYEPPDFNKIDSMINSVCEFVNSEPSEYYLHPIIKGIILHYLIGYLHPFVDGNGRTARALFYWYLISKNYDFFEFIPVSRVIKEAPSQYARAYLFSENDGNDITYFVNFHLHALDKAVSSFEKYVEGVKEENHRLLEAINENPSLNLRQADILVTLTKKRRPITITEVRQRYRITYQTARTDLLDLVNSGLLNKLLKGKQFWFTLREQK